MRRGIHSKDRAVAVAIAFALLVAFGCGASRQGVGEGEDTSGSHYASSVSTPSTQQTSPQGSQEQVTPERYETLRVGEPAEFKNGLIVTVEGASAMEAPESLKDRIEAGDLLLAVRFGVENANPEGQESQRSFRVSTAQWEALDQNGNPLQTLYYSETSLVAGELPNPNPDYPYAGWQGDLKAGQKRQGSMLFAAMPSTRVRVRFTQPVMNPPLGAWELGPVSGLTQETP